MANDASVDLDLTTAEQLETTVVEPDGDEIADAAVDVDLTIVEQHEAAVAEPDVVPEYAAVDVTVVTPADDVRDHEADCLCLACRSTAFEAVPVTEGPLAGKAFYFRPRRAADAS